MRRFLTTITGSLILAVTAVSAVAQTEYTRIHMEIDVNRSAEEVWVKVGGYCAISEWLNLSCEITSGDGGIGTVRLLADRIVEIMVAQTELSYGYTQPAVQGEFYNLYHGFMEARAINANSSKLIYTLVYDPSNLADAAAREADIERRRGTFQRALANMKALAEAD